MDRIGITRDDIHALAWAVVIALAMTVLGLAVPLAMSAAWSKAMPSNAETSLWSIVLIGLGAVVWGYLLGAIRMALVEWAATLSETATAKAVFAGLLGARMATLPRSHVAVNTWGLHAKVRALWSATNIGILLEVLLSPLLLVAMAQMVGIKVAGIGVAAIAALMTISVAVAILQVRATTVVVGTATDKHRLLGEAVAGMEDLRLCRGEAAITAAMDRAIERSAEVASRQRRSNLMLGLTAGAMAPATQLICLGLAGQAAIEGSISPGGLLAVSMILPRLIQPYNGLAMVLQQVAEAVSAWRMMRPVLAVQPEDHGDRVAVADVRGAVTVDATFRYEGTTAEVLRGCRFSLAPGQRLVITGESGCGKSTLLRLLTGLEAIEAPYGVGQVLLDDQDVRSIRPADLRRLVAALPQSPTLFSGTVLETIRQGDPTASDEEVVEAARLACAHEFIEAHPLRYGAPVIEGGRNWSGGQRQRLALARFFLAAKAARVVVLDELTAGLDTPTALRVLENLHRWLLAGNRTAIIFTHRTDAVALARVSGGRLGHMAKGAIVSETSDQGEITAVYLGRLAPSDINKATAKAA